MISNPRKLHPAPHCGSPCAYQTPKAPHHIHFAGRFLPTHTLSGRQDSGTTQPRDYRTPRQPRSPSRCGSPRAHPPSPKNASLPLTSCGSSPTLRGLKIVPSQVNRRPDTLKNSPKADPITIIIIVNSPILRIFRRLLLFSNE